ncbi:protein of unknown function (plasmid) [Pararobbsia alpina]
MACRSLVATVKGNKQPFHVESVGVFGHPPRSASRRSLESSKRVVHFASTYEPAVAGAAADRRRERGHADVTPFGRPPGYFDSRQPDTA